MMLSVFMDETSRTGQQRYNNEKWNFKDQPFFGLGALYIPQNKYKSLYQQLDETIKKENLQGEFKWMNKTARGRVERLFPILMDVIKQFDAKVHFEIEDKRFSIAKIITDYCVYPFYDMDLKQFFDDKSNYRDKIIHLKRAFASYIADYLSDSLLWDICKFFDSCNHNTAILKSLIRRMIDELDTKAIREFCLETIDSIEMVEKGKSPVCKDNLFPIKDTIKHNGVKTSLTIDPHTDCFSDLLCNATKYFTDYHQIECIHDVQDQWKPALEEAIDRMKSTHADYSIALSTKSGYHIIVNVVDYISGYLNQSLRQVFNNIQPLPNNLRCLCDSNITLVTSISLQEKIWFNNPDVIATRVLYDTIGMK